MNLEDAPIAQTYVNWANTLDSAGEDSGPARMRAIDTVTLGQVLDNMERIIDTGSDADVLKKWIFYGKTHDENFHSPLLSQNYLVNGTSALQDHNTMRIFHAILGLVGEASEMMEMFKAHVFDGKPLDMQNLIEESGDQMWYLALLAKACGFHTFDEFMMSNKGKLIARYGDKWNQKGAIERDIDNEMFELRKATGGTFTLTDGERTTDPIPFNSPGDVVEEAVDKMYEKDPETEITGVGKKLGLDEPDAEFKAAKERVKNAVKRCPDCKHQPHRAKGCYNIQSDNDCECETESLQAYTVDGYGTSLWNDAKLAATLSGAGVGHQEQSLQQNQEAVAKFPTLTSIVSQLSACMYQSKHSGGNIENNLAFVALRYYAYQEYQRLSRKETGDIDDQQTRVG